MRALLLFSLLAGCQSTADIRTHAADQNVVFGGFGFSLERVAAGPDYEMDDGPTTVRSATGFVFVQLAVENRTRRSVPSAQQPVCRLVDERGNEYEPSFKHSFQFNHPRLKPLGALSPGEVLRWAHVFEAPPRSYRLRVVTPSSPTAGRSFDYDIGLPGSR